MSGESWYMVYGMRLNKRRKRVVEKDIGIGMRMGMGMKMGTKKHEFDKGDVMTLVRYTTYEGRSAFGWWTTGFNVSNPVAHAKLV